MTADPRHTVWVAMSDLFLDTDVRLSYVSIVATLARSPYSLDELKQILDEEVTPVLQHNLLQVAGEWALFPEEWVIAEVSKRRGKRRWMPNLVNVDADWKILAIWIAKVRSDPPYLDALRYLVPLFLSRSVRVTDDPPPASRERLQAIYEHDLKPILLPGCRRNWKDSAISYPSEEDIEDNWRRLPI